MPWLLTMSALGSPGSAQAQVDAALRDAFLAFFPMYEMARLRHLAVDEPANPGRRAVNQFLHAGRLLDHTARPSPRRTTTRCIHRPGSI